MESIWETTITGVLLILKNKKERNYSLKVILMSTFTAELEIEASKGSLL